jgi:hypothetical protein
VRLSLPSTLAENVHGPRRAATNRRRSAEVVDSAGIIIFTRLVIGITSVGLNAMALVNEEYR